KIPLPGTPTVATYNGGTKRAYFGCVTPTNTTAGVAVVDDLTNTVVATIMPSQPFTALASNALTKKVYGVQGAQLDVIDGATNAIATTVQTPDQSPISGLAVDEPNNLVYVLTKTATMANLYVVDGATNTFGASHQILLNPIGMPPIAVDGKTQSVFVLGADSNMFGEEVTVDGMTGAPKMLTTTNSMVSPSGSGIFSLGDGTAALVFVSPGLVKLLGHADVLLPTTFTPTGVTVMDAGERRDVILVGLGSDGVPVGYRIAGSDETLSTFSLALGGDVFAKTIPGQVLTAAPLPNGTELYLDLAPDPKTGSPPGPAETIKIELTH
ncbi:MAG: hypothetical protein JWM82_3026, partial [Myxococcales bacterium]|nr:hypothetical protein [Myxococcales bacterium]